MSRRNPKALGFPEEGASTGDSSEHAGTEVSAAKEPKEVENGTLGQEGSTGASKAESAKAGNFGLSFTDGYEDPILLTPPQTASAEATETRGYESK